MRTPEEVAREMAYPIRESDLDAVRAHNADLIRDYAKEVAATQRDVTLVSFEWETTPGPIGTWNAPARRLVGPWTPAEP